MNNFTKSLVVVLAGGIIAFALSMLVGRPTTEAATAKPIPLRQFYLTRGTFDGLNTPQSACAAGYHMASQWEIFDVSNLRYDSELGLVRDDSGSGPLSGVPGWIRTGYFAVEGSNIAGTANCNSWTDNSLDDTGTVVELNPVWTTSPATIVNPWLPFTASCSESRPVWCVQD
jgi:hypothetical protein